MKLPGTLVSIVLLGVGHLLAVLNFGSTPLGSAIPAGGAAAALVVGTVAIVVAFATGHLPRLAFVVATGVALLLVISGGASVLSSTGEPGPAIGLIGYGVILFGLYAGTPAAPASSPAA